MLKRLFDYCSKTDYIFVQFFELQVSVCGPTRGCVDFWMRKLQYPVALHEIQNGH